MIIWSLRLFFFIVLWCWRRLLRVSWTARRSNLSILKETSPEYSLEGLILELQYFGHLMWRTDSLEKILVLKRLKAEGEGDNKGWDGWMASLMWWTWVWVGSGSWWWTGKPGVLQSMELQRVRHDWATELNWAVYSYHLFLVSSASVRSFPFLSFIVPIFVWNVSLVFPIFLTRSLVFLILFSSVQFSCSVVSDSLWPHGLLHARPPCPSPTPGVYSNSCPLSRWYHPTISISVIPFSSCLQSFPASGSFQLSQLFTSCGQSIPFYCFPLFLCIFYLRMLSSLSLLFSGTLHSVR